MASPKFYSTAKDYLTCPLCSQLYKGTNTPKVLDCHHLCCELCITKKIEDSERTMGCPECHHVTPISKDGVAVMKTNLMVLSLAEIAVTEEPICADHNEVIQHYCQRCNLVACSTCVVHSHTGRSHDVKEVHVAHKEQIAELKIATEQADSEVLESKRSIQKLEKVQNEIASLWKLQEHNIDEYVELATARVKEAAQNLKLQIRETEEKRRKAIKREITRLQKQSEEMQQTRDDVRKSMNNTRAHDYVVKHSEHVKCMDNTLGSDTEGHVCKNPVIGMIKYGFQGPFTLSIKINGPVKVRKYNLELLKEFGNFEDACAIAETPRGSLVVCDSEDARVSIYSQQKNGRYKKKSSLCLSSENTTKFPRSIAMTPEGKILVARWRFVEMYSSAGKYQGTFNFRQDVGSSKNEYVEVLDLKVLPNGMILISDLKERVIIIVSPKGKIINTVRCSIDPWRVAIMPHGYIAVSDFGNGKVCIIDLNSGREILSFHVPHATGLCYHEQGDCVLIGRSLQVGGEGGVIEQYCSTTGKLVSCVADGLCRPEDMAFTHDGLLAVADTKTIKMYKLHD